MTLGSDKKGDDSMKMKSAVLGIVSACVCMATGIHQRIRAKALTPVQGPLAAQTPAPVFSGKIRRPPISMGSNFTLLKSWTVANGETTQWEVLWL